MKTTTRPTRRHDDTTTDRHDDEPPTARNQMTRRSTYQCKRKKRLLWDGKELRWGEKGCKGKRGTTTEDLHGNKHKHSTAQYGRGHTTYRRMRSSSSKGRHRRHVLCKTKNTKINTENYMNSKQQYASVADTRFARTKAAAWADALRPLVSKSPS